MLAAFTTTSPPRRAELRGDQRRANAAHPARNLKYAQLQEAFKTANTAAEVCAAISKRWEQFKLLVAEQLFSLQKPKTVSLPSFINAEHKPVPRA